MIRNVKKFSESIYDIVVIGAGIQGASVSYEAALRGLKVCLLEKDDFVSKTSFNSLKIIHGGLRYLQKADIIRMRESIKERRTLLKIAPHLVSPLECITPTTPIWKLKSKYCMSLALLFNDIIGFDRNKDLHKDKLINRGKIVSKNKMKEILGDIDLSESYTAGAIWYDAMVHNSERLVLSYIHSGVKYGMDALNYSEITEFSIINNNINNLTVLDKLTNKTFKINCDFVINCSGASVGELSTFFTSLKNTVFTPVRVMNLITKRKLFPKKYAVGIFGKTRAFFFVPWRNYFMIGSSEKNWDGKINDFNISKNDITEFLDEINDACPNMNLKFEDISFVHKGLLPSKTPSKKAIRSPSNQYIIKDYTKNGINNFISVVPVKYTTARDVAEKVINLYFKKSKKKFIASKSAFLNLYGGDTGNFKNFYYSVSKELKEKTPLDETRINHLLHNFGSSYNDILKYAYNDPSLFECIPGSNEVTKAELMYAVKDEMAVSLKDVILRRTDLGIGEKPKDETIEFTASFLQKILLWDDKKLQEELNSLKDEYILLNTLN